MSYEITFTSRDGIGRFVEFADSDRELAEAFILLARENGATDVRSHYLAWGFRDFVPE